MKLRVIQWHDTKEFTIEKKTWWFGGWSRLHDGLFSWEEHSKWDIRGSTFSSELAVFKFLTDFATRGRMAFVMNEVSPVVIQPFYLKDLDKIIKEHKEKSNA